MKDVWDERNRVLFNYFFSFPFSPSLAWLGCNCVRPSKGFLFACVGGDCLAVIVGEETCTHLPSFAIPLIIAHFYAGQRSKGDVLLTGLEEVGGSDGAVRSRWVPIPHHNANPRYRLYGFILHCLSLCVAGIERFHDSLKEIVDIGPERLQAAQTLLGENVRRILSKKLRRLRPI